ncbi:hypothetical protein PFISCL1PPCAC_22779 [Pristionchus fissidentatus]|uniref:Solute carrier family 40 member n=1 Tax=Pristionchus fissidentatus TaxID=1538716 RepID=A0AAV5WNU0_9BILA|nr:hypothetical protein PFISCL1PPCAC_22779 [Pristionchus fissidentatus]
MRQAWRNAAGFVDRHRDYVRAAGTLDAVYFFSCVGDRLWAFSIGLFIADLGGMAWVALGQLLDSLIKLVLLPLLGDFLDRSQRHRGMQIILLCNNTFIALSAVSFFLSLSKIFDERTTIMLLVFALLLNALSRVASEAQKAAFMKDWIIVIVADSKVGKLSTHNTVCSAIDQIAAFSAPFLSGLCMEAIGRPQTAIAFMCWNLLSWLIEAIVIRHLYNNTPALHARDNKDTPADSTAEPVSNSCTLASSAVSVYFRQKCFRPAFALSLLFMTVLGFDNIAIAYGDGQGLSPATLGKFRSAGALLGFMGVWTYKFLDVRKVHVVAIGAIGLILQNVFLNLTTISIFLPGNDFDFGGYVDNNTVSTWYEASYSAIFHAKKKEGMVEEKSFDWIFANSPSLLFFFLGITGARFGLWMADPAIQEIMQETIPEKERYRVNLMQNALQECFSVLKDILVIAFPLAATFGGLIVMSTTFVFAGLLLYLSYFVTEGFPCRRRKSRPEEAEMARIELKVTEPGVHAELADLLEKGDLEGEAPLQTNRTDGL